MENQLNEIVAFPVSEGYKMIPMKDIEYIQSDGNYCKLFLSNGIMIHVSRSLAILQESLNERICIRTHHQYLVNKYYVTDYIKKDGQLLLKSEKKIPVSVRKRKNIVDFFNLIP